VELDRIVRAIGKLEHLPGLVTALGYEPLFHPVPGLGGPRGLPAAFVVGRAGGLPWFAFATAEPERAARKLARRLVQRGRPAGVIALDVTAHRMALSVSFDDPPVLGIDLDRPTRVALAALGRAGSVAGGALARAARIADALSTEAAGVRFFREFKSVLERMTLELPATARATDRRSFSLLQLTRVLFLYFVQAKGWLAGRERFLGEEVDRCLAAEKNVHRTLLRPLFFGTLNRPLTDRSSSASRFGAIPFLNGGLFEPHPLEREIRYDLSNGAWRHAFDRLFERFQFTVSESARGGIAPDMLGRVFEGVMAPDARRASGTYYTPATVVHAILGAALPLSIARQLDCADGEAERLLQSGHPRAMAAVRSLTILDPAVGSGAFLLGALERLAALSREGGQDEAARKRRILQHNLFGVDRSATAVRLAELRLWLAVIAGDDTERPTRVRPLPNLDCLVRQGDSLFDPVGAGVRIAAGSPLATKISALRRGVVAAVGRDKRPLERELRAVELRAAEVSLAGAEDRTAAEIGACLSAARGRDLFGVRRGLDDAARQRLGALRAELHRLRAARRVLARDAELPWFHYESHFADVFAAGGFDLVVGNPPWLHAERLPAEQRRRLDERYRWWRGGRAFGHRPDLSVAFLERSLELAAPGGVVALLLPAKLGTARYGAAARHALASTVTLIRLADLTDQSDAAFDATVYPLALVARKARPPKTHRVQTSLGAHEGECVPQAALSGGGPWMLTGGRARRAAAAMARAHDPLSRRFSCHLGLKTGANAVFLDPPASVERQLVRLAIRGRDVRPFVCLPRVSLLYTHDVNGHPISILPPGAAAHLAAHADALRRRADYTHGPPWVLFRTRAATARFRVVWSDLATTLTAAALTAGDDRRLIPLNTCYVTAAETGAEAERLAAWLNSTWIRAAARLGAVPAASGFVRFDAGTIEALPLPGTVLSDPRLDALSLRARRGEDVQHELDDLAASHLGLGAGEQDALRRVVATSAGPRG
jgi:hypothetical protein